MTNNELLLAMSDLLDEKLDVRLKPLEKDVRAITVEVESIKEEISFVKEEVSSVKEEVESIKEEVSSVKEEVESIKGEISAVKEEVGAVKEEQARMNLIIENEIRPSVHLLAENYVPAAKRYESASLEIDEMQADIEMLKKVVSDHSEKLKKIS